MAKSDEALMLQLQTGDLRSFDTLVKRWEKPLLNYCYRMVKDIELAEDLRQEVFLRTSVEEYNAFLDFWIPIISDEKYGGARIEFTSGPTGVCLRADCGG